MRNDGASTHAYQPWIWAVTIPVVDSDPASRNTATKASAIAISQLITWAAERSVPSSEYGDPEAQPASTMPYTPMELMASTSSTATGRSATCSGVRWWKIETIGPTGMMEKATKAGA